MSAFSEAVARHMATIPEGLVQSEDRMRDEMELRGEWPGFFARWRLNRMAGRGEIRRGPNTRSLFRSGRGWPTWGPMPGKGAAQIGGAA